MNASSQEELENRLHSLTESLIQKQTMLEALSTEKSSLALQLERMEVFVLGCKCLDVQHILMFSAHTYL